MILLHAGEVKVDFDKCIATPSMMDLVKKVLVSNYQNSMLAYLYRTLLTYFYADSTKIETINAACQGKFD